MRNPLMLVTISVDWPEQEWSLDCTRCDWSHLIDATRPALGALAQFVLDHVQEAHGEQNVSHVAGPLPMPPAEG